MSLTKLQKAVINQLGYEELTEEAKNELENIAKWGINGGYTGFIYCYDTVKFFNENKKLIMEQLEEDAFSLGEDLLTMITNFNCLLGNNRKPQYTPTEIMNALYDEDDENEVEIKNALAWYAGETVAYRLTEGE